MKEAHQLTRDDRLWISGHFFYHEDLSTLVEGLIQPLIARLHQERLLDGFFFVRFALGGPHVRLRVRVAASQEDSVWGLMEDAAEEFFQRQPSTQSLKEEVVREMTQTVLRSDASEGDTTPYRDNSFHRMPFHPEVERYGGPEMLESSLELFSLSSLAAFEFSDDHGAKPRASQLAFALRLLVQMAGGFAQDSRELADLLRYGVDSWGHSCESIMEKGEKVALAKQGFFADLLANSLQETRGWLAQEGSPETARELVCRGAHLLSLALRDADRNTRARIGGSHLHMTASRLGIGNAEEVYISQIATLSLQTLLSQPREELPWVESLGETLDPRPDSLESLVSEALEWSRQGTLRSAG